jgi:hypothetical protein
MMLGFGGLAGAGTAMIIAHAINKKFPGIAQRVVSAGGRLGEGLGRKASFAKDVLFMEGYNAARYQRPVRNLVDLATAHKAMPSSDFAKAISRGETIAKVVGGVAVGALGSKAGNTIARGIDYYDDPKHNKKIF